MYKNVMLKYPVNWVIEQTSVCVSSDKNFWVQGYTLISQDAEDCVPVFLRHIANDVYVCGKTINLLKICCPQVCCPQSGVLPCNHTSSYCTLADLRLDWVTNLIISPHIEDVNFNGVLINLQLKSLYIWFRCTCYVQVFIYFFGLPAGGAVLFPTLSLKWKFVSIFFFLNQHWQVIGRVVNRTHVRRAIGVLTKLIDQWLTTARWSRSVIS